MLPRVLIGAGAWVLGAVSATAGSIFAVDQIGQDLLAQQNVKQVSVATVNAELALENSERAASKSGTAATSPSPSPSPSKSRPGGGKPGATAPAPPAPGELLMSADGNADATCEHGEAYLVWWSPQPGYGADHVVRGPAQVATVTFRGSSSGIVMSVSCGSGVPVKHLRRITWGGHDD